LTFSVTAPPPRRARDELTRRFDRGDDRLVVLGLGRTDDESLGGGAGLRRRQGHGGEEKQSAHRAFLGSGLDTYMRII
jgi:hypothetical protein